jgi:Ca-activated chloride channel family protein
MNFAAPWAFIALLAIPLLIYRELGQKRQSAVIFPSLQLAAAAGPSLKIKLRYLPLLLRIIALILLITALARPQEGIEKVYDVSKGIAIEVVVDRSGSMSAEMEFNGETLNRLEVVKRVFNEFVIGNHDELQGRPNDLIGMISFARYSDTACPLTLAHDAVAEMVRHVQLVDRRSEDGTAIGDAVGLAAARLKNAEETLSRQTDKGKKDQYEIKSKIIILLTDGASNCGALSPDEGAALAKKWGIKIYTIGIGEEPVDLSNAGFFTLLRSRQSQVDTKTLKKLAESTGGIFRLASDGEALRSIYKEIDELETSEIESVRYMDYREYFSSFVLLGLGLLVLEAVLRCTLFRRLV